MVTKGQICDGPISQNTFHKVYKLCSKFHAFIKKCTIFCYAAPLSRYSSLLAEFANESNPGMSRITKESAKVVVENLQVLKPKVFSTDLSLTNELISMKYGITGQPLGIPLVPSNKSCLSCDGKLLLRNDRPSHVILYTESLGTEFYKYCQNYRKGQICSVLWALLSGRCKHILQQ